MPCWPGAESSYTNRVRSERRCAESSQSPSAPRERRARPQHPLQAFPTGAIEMRTPTVELALHISSPVRGGDVRHLVRELSRLAGVIRVAPTARFSRLLLIAYDPRHVEAGTFVERAAQYW